MKNNSYGALYMQRFFNKFIADYSRRIGIWSAALLLTLASTSVYACAGEDYQRTLQYIQYSQAIGYQCGLSGNPVACILQEFPRMMEEMQKLSPSCQYMLQQMNPPSTPGGGGGTMCQGGVCCDSSGCYGP